MIDALNLTTNVYVTLVQLLLLWMISKLLPFLKYLKTHSRIKVCLIIIITVIKGIIKFS